MPALDGLRILDMTQYEAGTSCTQALAWLGADVVKVEAPGHGDPGRAAGRPEDRTYSAYFCNWNANKRSVVIDLRNPEGRDLLLEMLPNYDVFVENYGPGVIERLGLDYETLKAAHPPLIHARIKGFGLSGPHAEYKSYDSVAQAAAGVYSVVGELDGPPMSPGSTAGDSGTGVQMGMAILAAYVQRLRTGEGQQVEISMQEAMTYYMRTRIAFGSDWGEKAVPRSKGGVSLPPVGLYPCKPFGPNDWVYIMPVTSADFDSFCTAIGKPELTVDERFKRASNRINHRDELNAIINEWMGRHTKQEILAILGPAGVPCSPVQDTKDVHNDPHLLARGFVKTIDLPVYGEKRLLGFGPRLSASDVPMEPAPLLGQHTDEVLAEDLGLEPDAVEAMRQQGVVG